MGEQTSSAQLKVHNVCVNPVDMWMWWWFHQYANEFGHCHPASVAGAARARLHATSPPFIDTSIKWERAPASQAEASATKQTGTKRKSIYSRSRQTLFVCESAGVLTKIKFFTSFLSRPQFLASLSLNRRTKSWIKDCTPFVALIRVLQFSKVRSRRRGSLYAFAP